MESIMWSYFYLKCLKKKAILVTLPTKNITLHGIRNQEFKQDLP